MRTEQIVALLTAERDRLSRAIDALQGPARRRGPRPAATSLNGAAPTATRAPKKRRLSAAGRKRIAEAARRRWAAVKAAKAASKMTTAKGPVAKPAPKKRRVSAAARKAMGDAARRRWAAARAAKSAAAKKGAGANAA